MARRPISEEERALWQSVAKTATPMKRRRKSEPKPVAAPAEKAPPKAHKKTKAASNAPSRSRKSVILTAFEMWDAKARTTCRALNDALLSHFRFAS